ncbi:hypothetical protein Mgra_00010092 [Meloidogyne graminicola]|uniref:ELM2 domain-containing protein n=1 Tax=Meloidogyne graminicola TaxID=189291 RepID=A0A8S9Z7R1_9BILA|nr:hypothetical protein Mgra_00010092 [Meloidogyne graminicola]KAF7623614.1 hypothetical protein Mgra_00010092 [Meloidogyne graminicola]
MHQRIKDEDLSSYCIDAFTNFGIEPERALFILFKSNYDFDKARYKLHNKHIINDSFCSEDAYAFRTALMSYGKNFARVKQILPHKTIASLVEHYYKTKKNQNYKGDFEHYTDIAANYSSSPSDDDTDGSEFIKPFCEVCKEVVTKIYSINGLEVCKTCKQSTNHYQIFPQTSENHNNYISKCPSDMQQICNEFVEMAKYINKSNLIEENNKDQDDDDLIFVIKKSKTICETKIEFCFLNFFFLLN